MYNSVNGVFGKIDTSKLGRVLIHDHVITCCDWSMRMSLGSLYFDEKVIMDEAVKRLKLAKKAGITTIVDGTPINLGRDIHMIRKAACMAGIQIIASSGFYHQEEAIAGFKSEDELTDLLIKDCTYGMADTGSRPGIMKCAVDMKGFTPYVTKILNVTARTAEATGLPVFCHTIPEIHPGPEVIRIFEDHHVPANKIVMGHHGDIDEIDYLEEVLKTGCYLGLDRFGIEGKNPATKLENRVKTLLELADRGWEKQLLIGHDYTPYTGFWPGMDEVRKPGFFENNPVDYTYFSNAAVPLLLEHGMTEKDIDTLLIDNPRSFFEAE